MKYVVVSKRDGGIIAVLDSLHEVYLLGDSGDINLDNYKIEQFSKYMSVSEIRMEMKARLRNKVIDKIFKDG